MAGEVERWCFCFRRFHLLHTSRLTFAMLQIVSPTITGSRLLRVMTS